MDFSKLALASTFLFFGCERPVTEPIEFARLCGPQPSQAQAEIAVREWSKREYRDFDSKKILSVVVQGPADRRVASVSKRYYGWKITFYIKTEEELRLNKFTDIHDILWNNGKILGGDWGY